MGAQRIKWEPQGKSKPTIFFTTTTMSDAINTNLLTSFEFDFNAEDATRNTLVPTRPSTPLPDKSAVIDLTPKHTALIDVFEPTPPDDNPSINIIALHSSSNMMKLWNRLLQSSLRGGNGGLLASDYAVVQATSPYYMRSPTRPCAWFIAAPGHLGRVLPSDETKLRSGVALRLEDSAISTYLPVDEYPINFVRLGEPIRREKGYIIYNFTSDLFSHYRTPRPEKAPTNLIAIPEFHAHSEAAHLVSEEATLHQRVLEDDYAIPPLRIWDNEWSPLLMEKWDNVTWGEEMEMVDESGQLGQEGQDAMM
jgi:hypothetical protein